MYYSKKIPLEQEPVRLIIKSFEDGEYEYTESFKEHPTVTQNGRGAAIWNNIYTQLVKNFSMHGFRTGIISRGPWDLVYLFDEKTKYLYTFMREANFANLHKRDASSCLFHYSNILSRLNGSLLGTYEPQYQQMSFVTPPILDGDTDEKLESMLQEMVRKVNDTIERYAIVLVDCKRGVVKNIECVIPIAYSDPMYREDWTEYIRAEYTNHSYVVEETKPDREAEELYVMNADINLSVREYTEEKQAK